MSHFFVVFGNYWLLLVIFGHFWSFMVILVIFGHFWSFLVISGHFWSLLVIFGHIWSFLPQGLGFATQYGGLWGALCAPSQPPACLARPCLRSPGRCRVGSPLYLATWRPATSPHKTRLLETWNLARLLRAICHLATWDLATWHGD